MHAHARPCTPPPPSHRCGIQVRRGWGPGHAPAARPSHRLQALQRVVLYDLYDRQVPYEEAWAWQKRLVEVVIEASAGGDGGLAGVILLLQHPPVYTLGAGSTEAHLRFDPAAPPAPLHRTERGGEVTYHGPGQLVAYPLLDLRRFRPDLHWYLRSLEEVAIRALAEVSGLQGERIAGLTGVWVGGAKVAAVGVRATRWVTYHGLALNVTTDLAPFAHIVPCGIADREVASVEGLLAAAAAEEAAVAEEEEEEDPVAGGALRAEAAGGGAGVEAGLRALVEEYRYGLVGALEEVFGLEVEVLAGDEAEAQLRRLASGAPAVPGPPRPPR